MSRLAFASAMDSLAQTCELMEMHRYNYERERTIRDNAIRDAIASGVKQHVLVKATGLSRQQITNISAKPEMPVLPPWEPKKGTT